MVAPGSAARNPGDGRADRRFLVVARQKHGDARLRCGQSIPQLWCGYKGDRAPAARQFSSIRAVVTCSSRKSPDSWSRRHASSGGMTNAVGRREVERFLAALEPGGTRRARSRSTSSPSCAAKLESGTTGRAGSIRASARPPVAAPRPVSCASPPAHAVHGAWSARRAAGTAARRTFGQGPGRRSAGRVRGRRRFRGAPGSVDLDDLEARRAFEHAVPDPGRLQHAGRRGA